MIKLFLITLLCAAVLADSPPAEKINQAWMEPAKAVLDVGEYAMTGQTHSLVRREAQPPRGPPPREGPPQQQ